MAYSIQAGIAKGRPVPEWYENEPVLCQGDEFYVKAFWDLSTCRTVGMSIGPIPWHYIVMYSDRYGLEDDVSEAFIFVVRQMDATYLKHAAKKNEPPKKAKKPTGGGIIPRKAQ